VKTKYSTKLKNILLVCTKIIIYTFTDEDKIELKKNFRKASTLCHPDKVTEEKKLEASQIFVELKEAYDQQDITKVSEIFIGIINRKNWDEYFKETKEYLKKELEELIIELGGVNYEKR
jgi:curved DNA-binding protein CbpA